MLHVLLSVRIIPKGKKKSSLRVTHRHMCAHTHMYSLMRQNNHRTRPRNHMDFAMIKMIVVR